MSDRLMLDGFGMLAVSRSPWEAAVRALDEELAGSDRDNSSASEECE